MALMYCRIHGTFTAWGCRKCLEEHTVLAAKEAADRIHEIIRKALETPKKKDPTHD